MKKGNEEADSLQIENRLSFVSLIILYVVYETLLQVQEHNTSRYEFKFACVQINKKQQPISETEYSLVCVCIHTNLTTRRSISTVKILLTSSLSSGN